MKKLVLFLLLFITFFGCDPDSGNDVEVTFKVIVNRALAEGEKVYIAGNHANLGNWVPDVVELEPKDIYLERKIKFPANTALQFKLTKGSWETEAVLSEGTVPSDYTIKPTRDTTVELIAYNWKDVLHKIKGQITGEVRYHKGLDYGKLKTRDVIVWLPPGYNEEPDRRYPVLYAHDGQNIIDPKTSYKGIDWQIDEVADSLIRNNIIEPFIIVGINNTADRSIEYSHTELGKDYMDFIVKYLKPMIDESYRTMPGREHTATLGSSMGGLIAFMLGWEKNEVFGNSACFSPAFKIQEINYVKAVTQNGKKRQLSLYIDNGTEGLESQLQPGIDDMMEALKQQDYSFEWYLDKGAEHDEAAWAERVWRPLLQFYKN